jgi:hypothetical protein
MLNTNSVARIWVVARIVGWDRFQPDWQCLATQRGGTNCTQVRAPAYAPASGGNGRLEIPAFLRKQAD